MCGIAGFLQETLTHAEAASQLKRMLAVISYRGPDDEGAWHEGPVSLGHRRLSIVDLSPAGHQPMISSSGRYVITFNGEIYNHVHLRRHLEGRGVTFKGHSDTEVLLWLIESEGLASALNRCVGMFAFGLWDRATHQLHLARDRFGEKPLYYAFAGSSFVFASELKAIVEVRDFDKSINPDAVSEVLRLGYVVAPRSIFRHARKLPPGCTLTISHGSRAQPLIRRYWDAREASHAGAVRPFRASYEEACDELEGLIKDAVTQQMQADVGVGTFLSGGIDSSLVTALAQSQSGQSIRTYSIGFRDTGFNEATYAKEVARHLGTTHVEWYVDAADALAVVPELAHIYDEPLADSSQIPTYILARLTRRDVTVALSGDGADEIFGGYPKYMRGEKYFNMATRPVLGALVRACNRVAPTFGAILPESIARHVPWHSLRTAEALYGAKSKTALADELSVLNRETELFAKAPSDCTSYTQADPADVPLSYLRNAMLVDTLRFMPDDILTKVDRATMAASLESRAPLLDHRIYEFASRLPDSFLFEETTGKRILRTLLFRYVPRHLVDRPKAGFIAPLQGWLRGPLREWAYDLLSSRSAQQVLDTNECQGLLDLHCQTRFDLSARIWPMVTLAAWAARWT